MDTGFETRIDFSALNEKIGLLREQMARVIDVWRTLFVGNLNK